MKRGAVRTSDSVFVGAWIPINLVAALDQAVEILDSDRSKIIREERLGGGPDGPGAKDFVGELVAGGIAPGDMRAWITTPS